MRLSTLAGIVGSDGHLSKTENSIIVANTDMEFLRKEVIPLFESLSNRRVTISRCSTGYGGKKYLVRIWDRELQSKLSSQYGIPRGKKNGIDLPELPPRKMMRFILGWIAGDGSVTHERGRPKIEIWSKDLRLMKKFSKFLAKIGIGSTMFEASNGRHILRIGRIDAVKRFSRYRIPHPAKARKLVRLLAPVDAGFSTS